MVVEKVGCGPGHTAVTFKPRSKDTKIRGRRSSQCKGCPSDFGKRKRK